MLFNKLKIHIIDYKLVRKSDKTKINMWPKPGDIELWPEQSYFAVVATVCFHSFKQLYSIVKCFGRRMQDQVMHRTYPRLSPATIASVLHLTDILQVNNKMHKVYKPSNNCTVGTASSAHTSMLITIQLWLIVSLSKLKANVQIFGLEW